MDIMSAFAMGEVNHYKKLMIFDWNKAAELIVKHGMRDAAAGLRGDWEWTGGKIFENGKPVDGDDTYTYLASICAVPELDIEGVGVFECYRMKSEVPDWGSHTYWPESALEILKEHAGVV
jgi:hypothetical protein